MDNTTLAILAMDEAVQRRSGKPFARIVSFQDLIKRHDQRISYDLHWRTQPPQPIIHSVDFEEPQILPHPTINDDVRMSSLESYSSDDESSTLSSGTLCDDDNSDMSLSVGSCASSRRSSPVDPSSQRNGTMMELLAPFKNNFWYGAGCSRRMTWSRDMDVTNMCSGAIVLKGDDSVRYRSGNPPSFLMTTSNAPEAIKPLMCASHASNTKSHPISWHLWNRNGLVDCAIDKRAIYFELGLYQEQVHQQSKSHIPIAQMKRQVDYTIYPSLQYESSKDPMYSECACIVNSPVDIVSAVWRLCNRKRLGHGDFDGLQLLDTASKVLQRFCYPGGRFFFVAVFKNLASDLAICSSWISDPFCFCFHHHGPPSPSLSLQIASSMGDEAHRDCWMQQICLFTNVFFFDALAASRKMSSDETSSLDGNYNTIPFHALFNFLQYLVVRLTPKGYKPHVLNLKQLWQFMLECCIVKVNYRIVSRTATSKPNTNTPYGTISFDSHYLQSTRSSNHLQFARQACESLSQSLNGKVCRVDGSMCHRVIYPFAKLLYCLRYQPNATTLGRLWSNGFVALATPPMLHLLDSKHKCWFSLEPCEPHVVEMPDIHVTCPTSTVDAASLSWTDCISLPHDVSLYEYYCRDLARSKLAFLGLWCGELGNVVIGNTTDQNVVCLLKQLGMSTFYGTDNANNLVKRSLVSML